MQLGLAAGGAWLGSAFGGTTGAMIGWLAGSYAGALLTAGTVRGSRIEDNTTLSSSYGKCIPIGYGTIRLAGNLIWQGERIEEKHTSGGKGGAKYESYTYRQSFAVAFANREIEGINKLWINNNLVYDSSTTGAAPDADAQSSIVEGLHFTIHLGTATQTADAIIEAEKGAGNVPGYRGIAYIVFDNLNLTAWNGIMPINIEAEITFNQSEAFPSYAIDNDATIRSNGSYGTGGLFKDPNRPLVYGMAYRNGSDCLVRINMETREIEYADLIETTRVLFGYTFDNYGWTFTALRSGVIDEDGYFWAQKSGWNCSPIFKFDPNSCTEVDELPNRIGTWGAVLGPVPTWDAVSSLSFLTLAEIPTLGKILIAVDAAFGTIAVASRETVSSTAPTRYQFYCHQKLWSLGNSISCPGVMDKNGDFWCVGKRFTQFSGSTDAKLYKLQYQILPNTNPSSFPGTDWLISWTMATIDMKTSIGQINHLLYDGDSHGLILIGQNGTSATPGTYIARYDIASEAVTDTLLVSEVTNGATSGTHNTAYLQGIQDGMFMLFSTNGGAKIRASDLSVVKQYTWASWGLSFSIPGDAIWDSTTNAVLTSGYKSGYRYPLIIYLDRVITGGEDLQDVVEDLCERSGLTIATDVEASDLAGGIVRGFKITSGTAVAALQQLASCYFFDGVASDWQLKFASIDKTSSATIDEDDLGADTDHGQEQAITEKYINELDIPYQIIIDYMDPERDYEINSQMDARCLESVQSRRSSQESYPLVFTASEARQIAQKRLYLSWNERNTLAVQALYRNLRIDPADVITIVNDTQTFLMRVKSADLGSGLTLQWEGTVLDSDALVSAIVGDPGSYNQPTVINLGQCDLYLFDIPLLRNLDLVGDGLATLYLGLRSYNSDWPGGNVLRSVDGYQWDQLLSQIEPLQFGFATNQLKATNNWETWDRFKTLTIQMVSGILASASDEVDCLNNKTNLALLKCGSHWEILQFVDVTDLGDGRYTLSNLLRGLNGSDPYMDGHYAGDLFILLDSDRITKYQPDSGEIGQDRYYRADTIGSDKEGVKKKLTLEGNSLKPWTVAGIAGTRDGSNNLTVTWHRRTRAYGEWMDGVETVALNETSESYEIDVIDSDGVTVLRTITATEETCSYTASQQTSDGLTPGDLIPLQIYQKNAVAGRGYMAEATV